MDVIGIRVSGESAGGCTRPVFRIPLRLEAERIPAIAIHPHAVAVFGPRACAPDVEASLDALARHAPRTVCAPIVLTSPAQLHSFQELIDGDRLFYLACNDLSQRDLDALIDSALDGRPAGVSLDRPLDAASLRRMAVAQSVAELADAMRVSAAAAAGAERTRCALFDRERQAFWIPGESDAESAAVGLTSFVLRTGATACVSRIGDDPRCDPGLDDPGGSPSDRFLAVPVHASGEVLAVLVAIRSSDAPPFEPRDVAAMEAVAFHASPYVAAWLGDSPYSGGPFRHRALRAADQQLGAGAEPLRLDSVWMRSATWLFVAALLALLAALLALKGWLA